jgi:voltage-dependent calcium channel T type alpha-1G
MSNYYILQPPHRDFICSQPEDRGMTKCTELPEFYVDTTGRPCNKSMVAPSGDGECVNVNQFYSACLPVGNNPFGGSISFDNIGYAWVTIFQVTMKTFDFPSAVICA